MYNRILKAQFPILNEKDEIELKEFKFFFGIHLLYPLKHDYNLDIPDFQNFSKKSGNKKEFDFGQIEFMVKFLHASHKAYCLQRGIDEQITYHQLYVSFDGEYQDSFMKLVESGLDAFMDAMDKEEDPKKPNPSM